MTYHITLHRKGSRICALYPATHQEDVFDVMIGGDFRTIAAKDVEDGDESSLVDIEGYGSLADEIWKELAEITEGVES